MGVIADSLRATLRELAHADVRLYRGLADELEQTAPVLSPQAAEIAAAIALLRRHGYTVTR
jgi:hypothetical protein